MHHWEWQRRCIALLLKNILLFPACSLRMLVYDWLSHVIGYYTSVGCESGVECVFVLDQFSLHISHFHCTKFFVAVEYYFDSSCCTLLRQLSSYFNSWHLRFFCFAQPWANVVNHAERQLLTILIWLTRDSLLIQWIFSSNDTCLFIRNIRFKTKRLIVWLIVINWNHVSDAPATGTKNWNFSVLTNILILHILNILMLWQCGLYVYKHLSSFGLYFFMSQ